jgi:hypothetical protein
MFDESPVTGLGISVDEMSVHHALSNVRQLLIQKLSHFQVIMGWCPILLEEQTARKVLLQLELYA